MPKRWRIDSLSLAGFRGIRESRTFDFHVQRTLIHGDNGTGKSTIALALHWALFGAFPEGILQNVGHKEFVPSIGTPAERTSVQVVLRDQGGSPCIVKRQGTLGAKTRLFSVQRGDVVHVDDAASVLQGVLGLDQSTFARAVLLQQGLLRSFITDDPKVRRAAMDRMIGVDDVTALYDACKPEPIARAIADARSAFAAAEAGNKANTEMLATQWENAKAIARQFGHGDADLVPSKLKALLDGVAQKITDLALRHDVKQDQLAPSALEEDLHTVGSRFRARLQSLRTASGMPKRLAELDAQRQRLVQFRKRWHDVTGECTRRGEELLAFEKACGAEERWRERHTDAQDALQRAKAAEREAHSLLSLLKDAKAIIDASAVSSCPVCEQMAAGIGPRLDARVRALATAQGDSLSRATREAEARVSELEHQLASRSKLATSAEIAAASVEDLKEKVCRLLGVVALTEDAVDLRLQAAGEECDAEVASAKERADALNDDIEAIHRALRGIETGVGGAIAKRDEIAAHEKRMKANDSSVQDAWIAELERRARSVEAIRTALHDARDSFKKAQLQNAEDRIEGFRQRLVANPMFRSMKIDVQIRNAVDDYEFMLEAGSASDPSRHKARFILSDGQTTATAMALFLGLAGSSTHNLDVLYVDDPSQALDRPSKGALAEVLAEESNLRQVIISTEDRDFIEALRNAGFTNDATVFSLENWDGTPTVSVQGQRVK